MSLAPCPSCSRHVKTTEESCPFCKTALAQQTVAAVPFVKRRMTRAAAYAFSASLVVAGCSGTTTTTGDGGTGEGGAGDGGTKDGPSDEGNIQPPYGAPAYGAVPVDAGNG
ncbi:hypothetical protein BH11MYX4_BH11MYX4_68820 [soil metagenome]